MIYSPSRTEAYDFCSMRGVIAYKEGWTPREADNSLVGRLVGGAFAKGTEAIHKGVAVDQAIIIGLDYWDRSVQHYVTHGVSFPDLTKTRAQLGTAFSKYAEQTPFKQWQCKGVEFPLVEYGNARLDYLGIDPEGYWAIADLKYKRQLKLDYLNKTINDYRDSWQFQHYPWAYNDWVKTWPKRGHTPNEWEALGYQPIQRIYLVLVIADPFKILTYPFFIKDKLQARWLQSAQQKWADIAALQKGDRQPTLSASHRDAFGDCPFKKACLEMDLDESLMQFEFCKVPRMEE
jgi:PD-(D/E)XK nuclease superfamily